MSNSIYLFKNILGKHLVYVKKENRNPINPSVKVIVRYVTVETQFQSIWFFLFSLVLALKNQVSILNFHIEVSSQIRLPIVCIL